MFHFRGKSNNICLSLHSQKALYTKPFKCPLTISHVGTCQLPVIDFIFIMNPIIVGHTICKGQSHVRTPLCLAFSLRTDLSFVPQLLSCAAVPLWIKGFFLLKVLISSYFIENHNSINLSYIYCTFFVYTMNMVRSIIYFFNPSWELFCHNLLNHEVMI